MKKVLPLIPILFFLWVNACSRPLETIPPAAGTALVETQTATMWTPTWTATLDPPENKIVEWLNDELLQADQLEQTLDARYLVTGVSFPYVTASSAQIFRVDLRCECPTGANCCIPERMFVVLMHAMQGKKDQIIDKVPPSVSTIKVLCYDHTIQNYVIGGDWTMVKNYVMGTITGYELGGQVFRTTFP